MKRFASELRKRAGELGITQAEVARRSGLTEQRYYNYVAGTREPDLATLVRIAEALQTTPDALLGAGPPGDRSTRSILIDRLNGAVLTLSDDDLRVVISQIEAFVGLRLRGS